ncbi:MAG: hypothetical protein KTR29_00695 [Rhodothermaceae bacterium]|nr:hypothetical protein [Rhodothermaceae bacterium]
MLGDKIIIRPEYFELSRDIISLLSGPINILGRSKIVLGIGGESGSGKSVTALCLKKELRKNGINSLILHQDDYFFLPPLTNHQNRKKDLANVGLHEVDMDLLEAHIDAFHCKTESIEAPLIDYQNNSKGRQTINFRNVQVLIVEGTYVLSLEQLDCRIFLTSDYKDTRRMRLERNRDLHDHNNPFADQVFEIEHQIIKQHMSLASIVIDKQYEVKFISEEEK